MNTDIDTRSRRELWEDALFSTETEEWDYGQWLAEALGRSFKAIEEFFGAEASASSLLALVAGAARDEGNGEPSDWRHALEIIGINALIAWPVSDVFRELGLYGRYGVTVETVPVSEREEHIAELLSKAERLIKAFEIETVAGKDSVLVKIVALARSRRNLDRLEGEVDVRSLAILGGVSEGRVRNMMSGSTRELENVGGRVSAVSASQWLQNRPEFFDSIWNRKEGETSRLAIEAMRDVVFLPVALDGTRFDPGLLRNGRFQIGVKGNETKYEDFGVALESLQRMGQEARWRRPNPTGNWSIVKVERWIPVDRRSLSLETNDRRSKDISE